MTYLFYLILLIVPLVTYPKSIDPFSAKTLLISITGFACLAYWINKEWKGISAIPFYFYWCFLSFLLCQYKLGNPGEAIILTIAYLGIFLYAKDYLKTAKVVPALLISLGLALAYNFWQTGIHFTRLKIGPSFVNANIYSGWLALILPVVFAWGLHGKLWRMVIATTIFGFGLIALGMVGCRSSWLGLSAAMACLAAFYFGRKGFGIAMIIIWLFIGLWWSVFPHQVIDPVRAHFWQGELQQIQAHPIIGTGVGSFRVEYPKYKLNMAGPMEGLQANHLLENAHNFSFQMISEIGIIGLGLFLFMLWRIWKRADKDNPLNLAMIAATFGFLCDNFYNVSFYYSACGMIFFLYLGLLASDTKREEKKDGKGWMARLGEWSDYCFFN